MTNSTNGKGKTASNSKIKIYNKSRSRGKMYIYVYIYIYWEKKKRPTLSYQLKKNQQIRNWLVKRKKNTVIAAKLQVKKVLNTK